MKIAIAQQNYLVGDCSSNTAKIIKALKESGAQGAELLVCSELSICGYPPMDLLTYDSFIEDCHAAVNQVLLESKAYPDLAIILGAPVSTESGLLNAALCIQNGSVVHSQAKRCLPNYDVFDEHRYFTAGEKTDLWEYKGKRIGITVCEDAWVGLGEQGYPSDPIGDCITEKADLIVNVSASPFELNKAHFRETLLAEHATKANCLLIFANQVGGNDQLIFDGGSMVFNEQGQCVAQANFFEEALLITDTDSVGDSSASQNMEGMESVESALVLGLRDYVRKTGFSSVVMGLSGGIDSALTCAIAVKALGKENVIGVAMPSPYSSEGSLSDAKALAENLGIEYRVIPISESYEQLLEVLSPEFGGKSPDLTEENMQARIRGLYLMALSNKHNALLCTTGNKSELAMGYCTLYGDMCGAVSVLADLPKTMVYDLSRWINRDKEIIPNNSISKAPSAELRPDQTDQDSLPPYEILDAILEGYIDERLSAEDIAKRGYDGHLVKQIIRAVDRNEYKRKQAPTPLRVTSKAFGVGRRMPIARG